jgi:hypothetical protein
MAIFRIPASEPAGGFQVYPAGTYKMEILNFERTTSSKGNPQLKVQLAIKEPKEYFDKRFTTWIMLIENMEWKWKDFAWAVGLKGQMDAKGNEKGLDTGSELFMRMLNLLKGREIGMNLSIEIQDGVERQRVDNFLRVEDEMELDLDVMEEEIPDFLRKKKGDA